MFDWLPPPPPPLVLAFTSPMGNFTFDSDLLTSMFAHPCYPSPVCQCDAAFSLFSFRLSGVEDLVVLRCQVGLCLLVDVDGPPDVA